MRFIIIKLNNKILPFLNVVKNDNQRKKYK